MIRDVFRPAGMTARQSRRERMARAVDADMQWRAELTVRAAALPDPQMQAAYVEGIIAKRQNRGRASAPRAGLGYYADTVFPAAPEAVSAPPEPRRRGPGGIFNFGLGGGGL